METQFYIQDPNDPKTTYLYESIIEQVLQKGLINWRGLYSFATGNGVENLFVEDPVVSQYLKSGKTSIVVGLDAVTNVSALEKLSGLNSKYPNFQPKVFFNPGEGLFHPKVSHFEFDDGRNVMIIGSGNLTPGGLRSNIEAYSVITGTKDDFGDFSEWDLFLQRHVENIKPINDDALEKAKINQSRLRRQSKRIPGKKESEIEETTPILEDELDKEVEAIRFSKVLIARVPAAGTRWHQIHYNKEVIHDYFQLEENTSKRVFLQFISEDGTPSPIEARPLIYSNANRNFKIEVSARRDAEYPKDGSPPIIVFLERGTRIYNYLLIMPGELGYEELNNFLEESQSVGKGHKRVIVDYRNLISIWPTCPL